MISNHNIDVKSRWADESSQQVPNSRRLLLVALAAVAGHCQWPGVRGICYFYSSYLCIIDGGWRPIYLPLWLQTNPKSVHWTHINNNFRENNMGLADRDYMRERRPRGKGPFTPPPSAGGTPALHIILIWLLLGLVLWTLANWFLTHQRATQRLAAPPPAAQSQPAVEAPAPQAALPTVDLHPANTQPHRQNYPAASNQQVIKCTAGGKTMYSDTPCPIGALATAVQITQAPPVPPQPLRSAPPPNQMPAHWPQQPIVIVQAPQRPTVDPSAMRQLECKALDEEIKHLDSWARQPNSGQTQDLIRDRRKRARDRQFEIHCP